MKAYKAWDAKSCENCSTVVFGNSVTDARKAAMQTYIGEYASYIDIRVKRLPEMDGKDRGRKEIDWDDPEDRKALVSLGWACLDTSWECDTCPERTVCSHWQEEE